MAQTRARGLAYLKRIGQYEPGARVAVSKLYEAEESWPGEAVWWFNLPIKRIKENQEGSYYLVGEERDGGYLVLKVPNMFLLEHLGEFENRYEGKIRLHIAAEGLDRLKEDRGKGKVDFAQFEVGS